jgi:hypothetical protein
MIHQRPARRCVLADRIGVKPPTGGSGPHPRCYTESWSVPGPERLWYQVPGTQSAPRYDVLVRTSVRRAPVIALVLTALLMLAPTGSGVAGSQDAACEFRLGFAMLHDLIPDVVGDCRENEWHGPPNGDGMQRTTGGLLVWRRADGVTTFIDGATTWINGPFGLQSRPDNDRFDWEPEAAAPVPSPPALPPGSDAPVRQAIADAARQAGVDPAAVSVVNVEPHEWPDSGLGCRGSGGIFAQVITPGFLVVLEAGGRRLEYHTDSGRQVVRC